MTDGSLALYLEDSLGGRVRLRPALEGGPRLFGDALTAPRRDLAGIEYRIAIGDRVLLHDSRSGRVEMVRQSGRRFEGPWPKYQVRPWLAEGRWARHTVPYALGALRLAAEQSGAGAAEAGELRVGDFVSFASERLGRIERIEGDEYSVRSLMPRHRWASRTFIRRREDLVRAYHDDVRRRLGLDLGESDGAPETATVDGSPAAPVRHTLNRASPATERSLAGRVLGAAIAERAGAPSAPPPQVPMPGGELTELFSTVAFDKPMRRYQALALDAFEAARAAGRRRAYLVMPPGSGKTVVGLEIARRLGNRTICLGPNTAIQGQWVEQWASFQPPSVSAGTGAALDHHLNALTYQAICDIDPHSPALDEDVAALLATDTGDRYVSANLERRRRLAAVQGGQHDDLLALLHPNGRRLLERIRAGGRWTVILDECHHLLEMWGYLLRAVVGELGANVFLVGLTATPPSELEQKQAELYEELFGTADFEVATPAVVKEGSLAPYQELVYLTTPLAHEAEYIDGQRVRFEELITALHDPRLGTVSFLAWFNTRFIERRSHSGAEVDWEAIEADQPRLAQAAVRFCLRDGMPIPPGARVREGDREPPTADDWVYLIDDYCVGHLRGSEDPRDLAAWDVIRGALPGLGYALGYHGVRSSISPVDRALLLSGSKAVAAAEILAEEERALGPQLRALILADFEAASAAPHSGLEGVLDPQAGSAAFVLRTLLADPAARSLQPILVTGRTVACSRATAADLGAWMEAAFALSPLFPGAAAGEDPVELRPASGGWRPSQYLPLITRYFESGRSRCLVGTRGLLGEGWDARSVNVLVDLTGVTTTTSVHQMRGRSLRLDPELPRKVADNWDVVCLAPDHPMGLADYSRFVRKHRNYFALTETGEIESGVSHVDTRLSPFGPPPPDQFGPLNIALLGRSSAREQAYARWGVGKPYQNLATRTVRVRFGSSPGLGRWPLRSAGAGIEGSPSLMARLVPTLLAGSAAFSLGLAAGEDLAGLVAGLVLIGAGLAWTGATIRGYLARVGPSGALDNLAAALADALSTAGLIAPTLSAASVRVVAQPDGYYRCYLAGAAPADSELFASSLDELLAPLGQPRYIMPRYVVRPPRSTLGALALLVREASTWRRGSTVVYHAVPAALAANGERVTAFAKAWHRHVGAGEPIFARDPRAEAIIDLQRGEDPFDVTTQMRTLWE